jgi:hypothetical protein
VAAAPTTAEAVDTPVIIPRRPAAVCALEDEIDPRTFHSEIDHGVKDVSIDHAHRVPPAVSCPSGGVSASSTLKLGVVSTHDDENIHPTIRNISKKANFIIYSP